MRLLTTVIPALALSLAGCATMNVSSHIQQGVDFTEYRTFDWGPADSLPLGDPRLDQNPYFKDYMEGALEKGLAARGLARATTGEVDLLLHYHASVTQRIDVNRLGREYGDCWDPDCRVKTITLETATLIVDIVDARTNRLVWRGWAEHGVQDMLDNPERMASRIIDAVSEMLERLPAQVAVGPRLPAVETGGN